MQRSVMLPDIPTLNESGLTGFDFRGWIGLLAPAGTPEDILQKVADCFVEAFATPKIKALHDNFGIPDPPTGLAETRRRWKDEAPQWIAIADRLGIKLD